MKKYKTLVVEAISALGSAHIPNPKGWWFGSAGPTSK